jgi:hypothetical protein
MNPLKQGLVFGKLFAQIELITHIMLSKLDNEQDLADETQDICAKLRDLQISMNDLVEQPDGALKEIQLAVRMLELTNLDKACEELVQKINETTDIDLV